MTDNFIAPVLDIKHPRKHLSAFKTPLGVRGVYDSVSFCSRCGNCQQSCPTLKLFQKEVFSPRGRNQAVRLLLEGKLRKEENKKILKETSFSCLLCGRCTLHCAGKVPTAHHMLELRRTLGNRNLPFLLQFILEIRNRIPSFFSFLILTGHFFRRWGFIRLLRVLQITRIPCLQWLNHADEILPRQFRPLKKLLPAAKNFSHPDGFYLPSFEAEFLDTNLGLKSVELLQNKKNIRIWHNTSSGLFEYVYGDLRRSRMIVRRLILRLEKTGRKTFLATDSIDVYNFFMSVPQLFAGNSFWKKKAELFTNRVRFIGDFLPKRKKSPYGEQPVRLDEAALFSQENEAVLHMREILKTQFKKNFVECFYTVANTPSFGYSFSQPEITEKIMLSVVRDCAQTQTGTVFLLSGLCALELSFHLKKFYPYAKAKHITCLHG